MSARVALVGLAKTRLDAGFSRVGRTIKSPEPADRLLMTLAARAALGANAVMALCERGLANESLPILRGLAEQCLQMRWLVEKDTAARAVALAAELASPEWSALWPAERWSERAKAYRVPKDVEALVRTSAKEFTRGAAQGLPWGHAIADPLPGRNADEVLTAAASLLGHVLKALDERWPGEFPGAEELWDGKS